MRSRLIIIFQFCSLRFFNLEQFRTHLKKEHYQCDLCKQDFPHIYYKDYESLTNHFEKTHYRCHEEECLATLFVVFETEEELHYHTDKVHRKMSQYKGGRTQYNASTLLGLNLEEENENDEENEEPEEIVDIPGVGQMSADALRLFIHQMENNGEEVPDYVYDILAQAKPKEKPAVEVKSKKGTIKLKDRVGIDFSRVVE